MGDFFGRQSFLTLSTMGYGQWASAGIFGIDSVLDKGLEPKVLAINVSKFIPASKCSRRQIGIRLLGIDYNWSDSDFSDQWVTFELDSFCVRDFSLLVIVRTQPTQSRLWSDLGPIKKERWYSNLKFKLEASKLCDIIICKVFYFPTLWSLNSPHWENIQIEKWKVQLQIEMLW